MKVDFGSMYNPNGSLRGKLSEGTQNIRSSVLDVRGDDTVGGGSNGHGGCYLFGSSVSVDKQEGIYVPYYSMTMDDISITTRVPETVINVAYENGFNHSLGFYQASDYSSKLFDNWETGVKGAKNEYYSRALLFTDVGDGTSCNPAGSLALWVQALSQTTATGGVWDSVLHDYHKEIYSQFLPSATTANWGALHLDSAQTGPANGRKIVFDGDRYHCVYYKQDPGTPVKYSVYYTYGCDAIHFNQTPTKLNAAGISSINPSLCLYKDGPVVKIGMTWEHDTTIMGDSVRRITVYFRSIATKDRWVNSTWSSTVTAATSAFDTSSNKDFHSTPVISQLDSGASRLSPGKLEEVAGLDSSTIGTQSLTTSSPPHPTKKFSGFLISFAQPEGYLVPPDYYHLVAAPDLKVMEGIYSIMVDSAGGKLSRQRDSITGHTSDTACFGVSLHRTPSGNLSTLPTLSSTESGNPPPSVFDTTGHSNSAYLSWIETVPGKWGGTIPQLAYCRIKAVPVNSTADSLAAIWDTLLVKTLNNFSAPNYPSIATKLYCQSGNCIGVPVITWQGTMAFVYLGWTCCAPNTTPCFALCPIVIFQPSQIEIFEREGKNDRQGKVDWQAVTTVFTDAVAPPPGTAFIGSQNVPPYRHPSITSNAYHGIAQDSTKKQENADLTAIICEHKNPSILSLKTYSVDSAGKGSWRPRSIGTTSLSGAFPNASFQTYGHYKYSPTGSFTGSDRSFTDAVYTHSNSVALVDTVQSPASTITGFAKVVANYTFNPDSLINYRSFIINADTNDYFQYTVGEFLVTLPDTTLEPIGMEGIPDTQRIATKTDIETVLRTKKFPITNGSKISFFRNISVSDTNHPFISLGSGKSIVYRVSLLTDSDVITLDTFLISGTNDMTLIQKNYYSQFYDTVTVSGLRGSDTVQAFVHVWATVINSDTAAYIAKDSVAYMMLNIFADNPANGDTTLGALHKRVMMDRGRAGMVPILPNPLDLVVGPNPFSTSTHVFYTIPVDDAYQPMEVLLIDLTGRDVSKLVSDMKPAGRYAVEFDGTSLPSANYVMAIHTLNHQQSKMIGIKR